MNFRGVPLPQVGQSLLILVCLLIALPLRAELTFHYADSFRVEEKAKLETWIREVHAGVEGLVGPYQFPIEIHFKRSSSAEPVPWAMTRRGRRQGVEFHVNPEFSLDELRADWTAAHELSHLIFPFVGRSNAWFAEGFASFMQYQVMAAMGTITEHAARERYLAKLAQSTNTYSWDELVFVDSTSRLRQARQYSVMYWGGSVLFFRLAARIEEEADRSLHSLLAEYLRCCRRNRSDLDSLATALDRLLTTPLVSQELRAFRRIRGFPSYNPEQVRVVPR